MKRKKQVKVSDPGLIIRAMKKRLSEIQAEIYPWHPTGIFEQLNDNTHAMYCKLNEGTWFRFDIDTRYMLKIGQLSAKLKAFSYFKEQIIAGRMS